MEDIVVYGAGVKGRLIYDLFADFISFFIDRDEEKQKTGFNNKEVLSIYAALQKWHGEDVVIAVSSKEIVEEIKRDLYDSGFKRVISYDEYLMNKAKQINEMPKLNGINSGYCYAELLNGLIDYVNVEEWLFHLSVWKNYNCKYLLKPIMEISEKYLHIDDVICDFGAGCGFWSLFFLDRGCKCIAMELDSERLQVLNRIKGIHDSMQVIDTDIRLGGGVRTGSCRVAFCANTLHVIEGWRTVVGEMKRVVFRNDGYIFFVAADVEHQRIKKAFDGSDRLQIDCTIENISKEVGYNLVEDIYITQEGDNSPSHHLLLYSTGKD